MPQDIPKAKTRRKIVVVGAGPGGLEAARVASERGHEVTVFEASAKAGGQLLLAAQSPRRRELLGISEWRVARCEAKGVRFRFNTWAEPEMVMEEKPDVVIIATGGLPDTEVLKEGNGHVISAWDILSGEVKPGRNVLIYDDAGDHAGLQAAEFIAQAGGQVEIMTRDRAFAPEVMAINLTPYIRSLQKMGARFTVTYTLDAVRKEKDTLVAVIGSDYGGIRREQEHDQIIVNHGTLPNDSLYHELLAHSSNGGELNYMHLIDGIPQDVVSNPEGKFALYRIGDAVAARNTHAAIYDALRLLKDI